MEVFVDSIGPSWTHTTQHICHADGLNTSVKSASSERSQNDGIELRNGTKKLAKSVAVYFSCLSFPAVYLISAYVGASWSTALLRGVTASLAIYYLGPLLFFLLADTLLTAITDAGAGKESDDT